VEQRIRVQWLMHVESCTHTLGGSSHGLVGIPSPRSCSPKSSGQPGRTVKRAGSLHGSVIHEHALCPSTWWTG
jgi:hypothetical protein